MEAGGKGLTRALGVGRARAAAAPGRAEAALLRESAAEPSLQSRHCRRHLQRAGRPKMCARKKAIASAAEVLLAACAAPPSR